MKAEELAVLLQCPKMYELKQVLLDEESQRSEVRKMVLGMLAKWFADRKEWDAVSEKAETFLRENLKVSWFELHWQKKAAVRDDLFRLRRLYCWLFANIEGAVETDVGLEMEFQDNCGKYPIQHLEVKADLVAAEKDGTVLGILLYPKLPRLYRCHAGQAKEKAYHSVELLCLMGGLRKKYPDRPVDAIIAGLEQTNSKGKTFSTYEGNLENHVIRFTDQEFTDMEEKNICGILKELIRKSRSVSCRNCVFEDICRYPGQTYIKNPQMHTDTDREKQTDIQETENPRDYTENQKKAIRHREGPLRVCAGPGAGKTAVLAARIHDLIDAGHSPERILAVTFTKKAAKEILERMPQHKKPVVSTLHALAFQIVRNCKKITITDSAG